MSARLANEMPIGWRYAPLEEVCEVIQGQSPPGNTYNAQGRGLPFFQGKAEFGDYYPTPKKWCSAPAKIAEPDDVLISIRAPVGPTNLCLTRACIGRGLAALRPKDGMPSRYLLYAVRATVDRLVAKGTGSTFEAVSGKDLRGHKITVAPPDEQRRIVAEIEKQFTRLEAGVAGLRRVQANLKRYRAAVLKAACEGKLVPTEAELARQEGRTYESGEQLLARILTERRQKWTGHGRYKEPTGPDSTNLPPPLEGWTWCMSDSLFSFVTSGSRGWAKYYSDSGAIFLRIGNLDHENIRLDLGDIQHVTPPTGTEGVRTMVQANDILISITADVGMVALVPDGLGEAYINQHVALARPSPPVCPRYVAYYLCGSEGGWGYFKKLQRGATKVGLGLDDIRSVPVPLPPLAEQERIVAEVERRLSVVEELEAVVSASLQRGTRLRQAVLQLAFEGKLVRTEEVGMWSSSHDLPIAAEAPSTYKQSRERRRK